MKHARFVLALVLALPSCTPPKKASPAEDQKNAELAIVMAVGIQETSNLKVGQWALWSVRSEGSAARLSTRLAVVGQEGDKYWIENRTTAPDKTGRHRTMISKYQIDSTGKPLQLWVAEMPGGRPAKVDLAPPPPLDSDPKAKVDVANEKITVASTGKAYDCARITSHATYSSGAKTTLVTWCSKEVPFSAVHDGKSYGGVVRRTYGDHTLELDAKGSDAMPELTLPEGK
jgi:hypothetical protein